MTRQLEIAGTEVTKNADVEASLDAWLEAKDQQRTSADTTKLRHATLLLHLATAGLEAYPYVDPKTGKKKQVVVARDPKAKTTAAPRNNRRNEDADVGDEVTVAERAEAKLRRKAETEANRVEVRRVSRASVEDEINPDPFAATRAAIDAAYAAPERAPEDLLDDPPVDESNVIRGVAFAATQAKKSKTQATKKSKGRRS